MNREETVKEVIEILQSANYVDTAEHLYDGLKQIRREITDDTLHDFLWALESPTVLDVDGKIKECINKIKPLIVNNEMIPVKYNNKVVGYTEDEGKTIVFDNSEDAKLLLQSLDTNIGISSRGVGKISEDIVIEREVKSLDIFDLEQNKKA